MKREIYVYMSVIQDDKAWFHEQMKKQVNNKWC
jgi:hypothetical protein